MQNLQDRIQQLEEAVIDRESRLLSYASIIRSMSKGGYDPKQVVFDTEITEEESRVLGITRWRRASLVRQ